MYSNSHRRAHRNSLLFSLRGGCFNWKSSLIWLFFIIVAVRRALFFLSAVLCSLRSSTLSFCVLLSCFCPWLSAHFASLLMHWLLFFFLRFGCLVFFLHSITIGLFCVFSSIFSSLLCFFLNLFTQFDSLFKIEPTNYVFPSRQTIHRRNFSFRNPSRHGICT